MSSNEVVALIGDIVWPFTVLLILIVLRREVRAIFHALQKRIADPHTPVKLTREGLELSSRVEVLEGVIETQQLKTDVLASATVTASAESRAVERVPQTLLSLRDEYIAIDDEPNRERRIQKRNEVARSMGAEVLRMSVNRKALVSESDEIMTLALASAVTALPESGDDVLILTAGKRVHRLHVRYRIAAAVSELAQSRNLQPNLVSDMEELIGSYRKGADDRLIRRINWTLKALSDYARQSSAG